MKYGLTFILLAIFTRLQAQNPCTFPISTADFNKKMTEVRQVKEVEKISVALQGILDNHCFTTAQVSEMLKLMGSDVAKADFAIRAYERVLDKWSYYEIFDNFRSLSSAIRAYDQTLANKNSAPEASHQPTSQNKHTTNSFSNPPSNTDSITSTDCLIPEAEFEQFHLLLSRNTFESARLNIAKQMLADKKCLSSIQLGMLSRLFTSESSITDFLVYSYQYVPDKVGFQNVLAQHNESVRREVAKALK